MFDENIFNEVMKEAKSGKKGAVPKNQEEQKRLKQNKTQSSKGSASRKHYSKKHKTKQVSSPIKSSNQASSQNREDEASMRKKVESIFISDHTDQQSQFTARATAEIKTDSARKERNNRKSEDLELHRNMNAQTHDVAGWLEAEELRKKELAEAHKSIEQLRVKNHLLQQQIDLFQQQYSNLTEEVTCLQASLSNKEREIISLQEEKHMLVEQQKSEASQTSDSSAAVSVVQLLEDRGLNSRREHIQFLSRFAEDSRAVHFISNLNINQPQKFKSFLREHVRLERAELQSFSNDVVRVDVSGERCEITGGQDLESTVRELMTAFLCSGLNRIHVFGGPSRLTSVLETLVRHQSFMLTTGGSVNSHDVTVERAHMIVLWSHPESESQDPIFDLSEAEQKSTLNVPERQVVCCSQAHNLVDLMKHMLQHIEQ